MNRLEPRSAARPELSTCLQRVLIACLLVFLASCGVHRRPRVDAIDTVPRSTLGGPQTAEEIERAYSAALEAARSQGPALASNQLLPILPSTPGLIWNNEGQVRMVTWTRQRYYRASGRDTYRRGEPFPLYGDTWFLAAPFLRRACRGLELRGETLELRLKQLIGLPPNDAKDAFLEVWIDPADLFRPCLDPEITDRGCQTVEAVEASGDPPWTCPTTTDAAEIPNRDAEHRRWLCETWHKSFDNADPFANFPWTALGYTYDWGRPENPRGLSELVARRGTIVRFHALKPTERYCR